MLTCSRHNEHQTIAREMNASKTAVFSLGTVFSLSATVFQQPVAELSHVLGRKPAFLFVLGMFFVGSVVAATADNMIALLAGRAMQGFACGGSVLAAIILTDLIELKDRATWLAYQNGIQALGLVTGPLIGAALLRTSWVCPKDHAPLSLCKRIFFYLTSRLLMRNRRCCFGSTYHQ